tara:strand:+ start:302 stop:664 length:363 start_codon:yes stop_codon:yes gene_type:complete
MTNEPEQIANEGDSVVQEAAVAPKKAATTKKKAATKRKATVRRKAPTAKSKRRRPSTTPLAPPPPLTMEELREQGVQAKQEVINAVVEPAVAVVGSLSQTIRDTISGAFAGLLSRKRRDD